MNPAAGANGWIEPDWPAPPGVRALCSTRHGGISAPPWDSANLGDHVGDAAHAVAANRAAFAGACGAEPLWLRQVHGTAVHEADAAAGGPPDADASTTTRPGIACTVMVADCLPVLFTDAAGTRVAAAHAGWRGLAGGVLEAVLERFRPGIRTQTARAAPEIIAWLGPCIGPGAFEVGPDVRAAFDAAPGRFVARGDRWLADLPGLARARLRAAGVTQVYGNDGGTAWCTVANPSRFFSHRRDGARLGASGRFAAAVWLQRG